MSADRCTICSRDPARVNNAIAECSHVDCRHRQRGPWEPGCVRSADLPAATPLDLLDDPEAVDG